MSEMKLGECCLSISDGDHMPPPKATSGIPFLTISDINSNNHLDFSNTMFVPKEYWNRVDDKRKAHIGDVLLSVTGSYGVPVYIDFEKEFVFQRHISILKPNAELLSGRYLYYLFKNPTTKKMIDKLVTGAIQKTLGLDMIRNMSFDIPPVSEQDKITSILSQIDDLIDNNTAICTDLESVAKLLYDYWFVQFDFPDENGRPYKSSGGKMVWNEELKREIPEGWGVKHLSDIAGLQQNAIFPTEGVEYNHYSIPAFDESKMPSLEDGGDIASNKYVVPNESILVSKLNPQFKRIWLVLDPSNNAICSTEFLPVKAMDVGIYYLYSLLNTDAFSVHLKQKASSSTGSRKRIDPENVMSFPFAYNKRVARLFNEKTASLIQQTNQIPIENQQLASLRDFLLPMLMNGQVKVGKAGE